MRLEKQAITVQAWDLDSGWFLPTAMEEDKDHIGIHQRHAEYSRKVKTEVLLIKYCRVNVARFTLKDEPNTVFDRQTLINNLKIVLYYFTELNSPRQFGTPAPAKLEAKPAKSPRSLARRSCCYMPYPSGTSRCLCNSSH
jgi:hypothetical protein